MDFYDMKTLEKDMAKCLSEMEVCAKVLADAEASDDTAKVEAAVAESAELSKTFEKLQEKATAAKKHGERLALHKEIQGLSKPVLTGASIPHDGKTLDAGDEDAKLAAEAKDHVRDERAVHGLFMDYVCGKELSGEGRKKLTPKSETLRKSGGVILPSSIAARMMGPTYALTFEKAMFSVATPAAPNINPSGGQNLVPPDFRAQLLSLAYDVPTVLDRVTVIPNSTGAVVWPVLAQTSTNEFGGVTFQWMGEGAEKPKTEPEFEQKSILTHELCGYTEVSERLLSRSAIQIERLLTTLFRGAAAYQLDNAIIQGTGVGMPAGIVGTAGINLVNRAAAGAVGYTDLVQLKHAVKAVHRGGAAFVLEDSVELGLELTTDGVGRPLFNSSVANGPYDRLTGYPFVVGNNQPTVGTQGDIFYGNLKHYYLVMEEEITIARSEHVKFRENLIAFKVYLVVGGRLIQPRAFSILSGIES